MISQAQDIQRELIEQINHNDSDWVINLSQFDQYCGQNLSSHAINGAVVTKFLIDGAEFF
jgi:hypothetical protein